MFLSVFFLFVLALFRFTLLPRAPAREVASPVVEDKPSSPAVVHKEPSSAHQQQDSVVPPPPTSRTPRLPQKEATTEKKTVVAERKTEVVAEKKKEITTEIKKNVTTEQKKDVVKLPDHTHHQIAPREITAPATKKSHPEVLGHTNGMAMPHENGRAADVQPSQISPVQKPEVQKLPPVAAKPSVKPEVSATAAAIPRSSQEEDAVHLKKKKLVKQKSRPTPTTSM